MYEVRFPTDEKIERYWTWLKDNLASLEELIDAGNEDLATRKATNRIKSVSRSLAAVVDTYEGKNRLAISAEGIKEAFPIVDKMVEMSPEFENWIIVAYKQPVKTDENFVLNNEEKGVSVAVKDVFYETEPNNGKYDITFYFPQYSLETHYAWLNTAFKLLDRLLGEYDKEVYIENIKLEDYDKKSDKTRNILQLKEEVEKIKK